MKAINSHAQFVYPVKWGEILGINLKKQEKVPRAQDGCPLKMSSMTRKMDPTQQSGAAFYAWFSAGQPLL
jgi:hypothetical protein